MVNQIPGYRMCEYLIVLDPGPALSERIMVQRDKFNTKFKVEGPAWKPNLLLASFRQYAMWEEKIKSKLNTIAMGSQPFMVEVDGFGALPSHSIYVAVKTKIPLQNLVRRIRTEAGSLMKQPKQIENKAYWGMEPNFFIARKLLPWQYEKAWPEYNQKHFTGRFVANEMLLLKRNEGESAWQVAKHLQLQNLAVETKQAVLF